MFRLDLAFGDFTVTQRDIFWISNCSLGHWVGDLVNKAELLGLELGQLSAYSFSSLDDPFTLLQFVPVMVLNFFE